MIAHELMPGRGPMPTFLSFDLALDEMKLAVQERNAGASFPYALGLQNGPRMIQDSFVAARREEGVTTVMHQGGDEINEEVEEILGLFAGLKLLQPIQNQLLPRFGAGLILALVQFLFDPLFTGIDLDFGPVVTGFDHRQILS
jgi:hypothetical protein